MIEVVEIDTTSRSRQLLQRSADCRLQRLAGGQAERVGRDPGERKRGGRAHCPSCCGARLSTGTSIH
ncbi:MAG: hypothetical protein ACYC5J_02945 [Chloroflexota bacterium]